MSNIEQIDFSTLTWVKTELDETLNRAKDALKTYVEDTDDTNQLQFCITYLHQIQGTLKMVELYGAAMVAEEMESVAKDLMNGSIKDEDSAYDVLMQSILQLPDYLERIELGHKDVPIVLLPLVNDLRSVRSQKLLSESALFNPKLELGVPDRVGDNDVSLKGNQLKTALLKIRSVYQISLLNWIKQNNSGKAINNIKLVVSKLQMILSPVYLKQLFWTYSGLLEGLQEGHIDDNVTIKQIAGKVDLLIKELGDGSPHTKSTSRSITRNLLYYIAISEGDSRLLNEIRTFFDLSQFIPDEEEIKHAEGSLSGKNKELLQTVSDAIKDDVLVVQESLDLYIRNKSASVDQLTPILDNLHNISDTLGILGLGVARDSVKEHTSELKTLIDDDQRPSDDNLLEVAKTLLKIESQLGDHIQSLGVTDELAGDEENAIPKSEKRAILQQLAKESIINLQQIKTNFVAFIESPWDKNQVQDNPRLLKDIAGALKILNLTEAGDHLESIIAYVNTDILASDSKPSAMELEQLATVISSLEYYLENLDQGQRIRDSLLAEVKTQIEQLQQHVANDSALRKSETPEETASEQATDEGATESSDNEIVEDSTQAENEASEAAEAEVSVDEDATESASEAEAVAEPVAVVEAPKMPVIFGDDVDDEIKEVFLEEFEEELANMQEKHAIWKEDPETNTGELGEIRRIFHTLKGSGRLVGAEAIGEFGWQLENMCNRKLDNAIENLTDFRSVLSDGVVVAAGLFAALQNEDVVPDGYSLVLQNAENVTNGKELVTEEAVEAVVETQIEEVAPVDESPETIEEPVEVDEVVAEAPVEEAEETDVIASEVDESESAEFELDLELEPEAELELDSTEEPTEIADELTLNETVDQESAVEDETASTVEDEATDDSEELEDIEFDLEDLSLDETEPTTSETEDVAEKESEEDEDDFMLEFDLGTDEVKEATEDDVPVALMDSDSEELTDESAEDEEGFSVELSESDEFDLEQELADMDLDDDSEEDHEAELAEQDDGINLALDEATTESDLSAEEELDLEADLDFDLSEEHDVDLALDEADSEVEEINLAMDEVDVEDVELEPLAEEVVETSSEDTASDQLDVDPVFIEILQKEVGGHLNEMSQFVSKAMEDDDPKVSDDFIRVVHTLNGAASMASVEGITQMTTPLEKMSIMMLDKDQSLTDDDVSNIEKVIHHAKSQMNLLGTGDIPVDNSVGEYFKNRIQGLYAIAAEEPITDSVEDLVSDELTLGDIELEEFVDSESSSAEASEAHTTDVDEDVDFDETSADTTDLEETTATEDSVDDEMTDEDAPDASTEEDVEAEAETAEADAKEDEPEEAELEEAEPEEAELEETDEAEEIEETEETDEAEEDEVVSQVEDKAYNLFEDVPESESDDESGPAYEADLDEELLEIFSEEASEIFDRADHLLAELEEKPDSPNIIQALQRDLHTLKGGARMAGLNQIGDLSHQLESLFESIAEKNIEVNPDQHELMSQVMHKLHGMVNADDYGQLSSIEKETKELEQILSSEGGEIKEKSKLDEEFFDPLAHVDSPAEEAQSDDVETLVPKKKANVLSGGQIKVNSELLDKLVNFAGEVSIYRSRMEQQSAELKLNIDELENTVERVRRQLRELEHETEAQIISNYQAEGDELEEDFDPLELDQFSTIQQLSRSLSESVSDLTNIQTYLQESARSSETLLIQQSRVNTELQEGLMETRLVTFNSLIPRLRRVLRTAGQELSKNAKLVVKGAEGEMDKTVLEGIQAPLEHMIRNAMVHGLEADRKAAGKPEQGKVVIELSREATEVVITVKDDGGGINTDVLRKKAIDRGIISKGSEMSDSEVAQLITHSGLSAADEVTKLAGRGVGMDVVNNEIKRLGGSIEIISESGVGSTFVIRLPYTLALTQAIIVQVADHRYAIPASGVQGLIRMSIDEFRRRILENDLSYDYAGEEYNIQELNKLLSVDSEALVEGNQVPLVMIKSGDQGVALRVDQTFGGREIVVKSVGTQVASVPGIFGATILGDGAVVLILDIIPMHRAYVQKLEKLEIDGVQPVEEVEEDRVTTIMVVDDSITMRRAGERMLARNDFEVLTAKDGLDALNKLQEQKPDLMLLDIEMPRMDGFELATAMKQSERFADIPIIMITSRTGQKHKDRAKEIGVERYLGKPYQELELLDNINDLLQLEDA